MEIQFWARRWELKQLDKLVCRQVCIPKDTYRFQVVEKWAGFPRLLVEVS
jgi:hypothetical protein